MKLRQVPYQGHHTARRMTYPRAADSCAIHVLIIKVESRSGKLEPLPSHVILSGGELLLYRMIDLIFNWDRLSDWIIQKAQWV